MERLSYPMRLVLAVILLAAYRYGYQTFNTNPVLPSPNGLRIYEGLEEKNPIGGEIPDWSFLRSDPLHGLKAPTLTIDEMLKAREESDRQLKLQMPAPQQLRHDFSSEFTIQPSIDFTP